eukprot:1143433-Pelagomonas_calceolata.AAC.2
MAPESTVNPYDVPGSKISASVNPLSLLEKVHRDPCQAHFYATNGGSSQLNGGTIVGTADLIFRTFFMGSGHGKSRHCSGRITFLA